MHCYRVCTEINFPFQIKRFLNLIAKHIPISAHKFVFYFMALLLLASNSNSFDHSMH